MRLVVVFFFECWWFVPIFKVFVPINTFQSVFCEVTWHISTYYICRLISWADRNDVKGVTNSIKCTYHITLFPILQWHLHATAEITTKRIVHFQYNRLKWQRKFKWHTDSNEKSNSFSFPIQNCKWYFLLTISRFTTKKQTEHKIDIHRQNVFCNVYWAPYFRLRGKNAVALINC